jgi:hypothetical protein
MMTHVKSCLCLLAILGFGAASTRITTAQSIDASENSSSAAPVAFVYVSGVYDIGDYKINGFAVAADGRLTPIPGQPFKDAVTNMAVNGKYLFGASTDGIHINSYLIGAEGALHRVASTLDSREDQSNVCYHVGPLFLDHTGATLYVMESGNPACSTNRYQDWTVDWQNGTLKLLGFSEGGDPYDYNVRLTSTGNNLYAYGAACQVLGNSATGIYGFQRNNTTLPGWLAALVISAPLPSLNDGYYCPQLTATDPSDHVAVIMEQIPNIGPYGPFQIATYTSAGSGNLKLTSTTSKMPLVDVGAVLDMKMSPSGKLLAVGGVNGLQLFHFNGAGTVTAYSEQLDAGQEIQQMFWDNANHLYAISTNFQQLLVYTITPTSLVEAPGSPYPIQVPVNLIVQPLTKPPVQ